MGTYDDERSGNYDNSYNRNFYKTTDRRSYNDENVNKKVDSIIDEMDKKVKEKPFLEKIYFLMDVVHNNITYDYELRDFTYKKEAKMNIFKNYYDYKNSAKEVIKNKKGTCAGFSNTLKTLCEGSGIECKIMIYKNSTKNMDHQLNTVFDNGKKYYVDPTWGFIVEDLEELKAIYRGEKPNPRTNQNVYMPKNGFANTPSYAETIDTNDKISQSSGLSAFICAIKNSKWYHWVMVLIFIVLVFLPVILTFFK